MKENEMFEKRHEPHGLVKALWRQQPSDKIHHHHLALSWSEDRRTNSTAAAASRSPRAKHPPCTAPWSPAQGAAPAHRCYPTSLRWDHGALEHCVQSSCKDTVKLPCGYRDSQSVSRNKIQSWNAAQVITTVDTLAWWLLPDWAWVQNKQE